MAAVYGRAEDPITSQVLGRPFPVYRSVSQRVADRVGGLSEDLSTRERAQHMEQIELEESDRRTRQAVAGFDLTFSPMKSVSALWAIANPSLQSTIVAAHHRSVEEVIAYVEQHAAFTRTGQGGIAQIDTRGLIGAAFDHWDSRAGDPQLHTHVVLANRVQGTDGRWRTLDGRSLYQGCVALSELYNDLLADDLHRRLGVRWEHRDRGERHVPAWEIEGVPEKLIHEFSTRTAQIEANLQMILDDRRASGAVSSPTRRQLYVLQQQATLLNRPHKHRPQPLANLMDGWRLRAVKVKADPAKVVARAVFRSRSRPLRATDLASEVVSAFGETVVLSVQQRRSTWNQWNLMAEAARQTRDLRLASPADRIQVVERIADIAQRRSTWLTAPSPIHEPREVRRRDGESVFTEHRAAPHTSAAILGAEAILLDLANDRSGPRASVPSVASRSLSLEQAEAIARIASSRQIVEALTGPAGAGKTATLAGLRDAWEASNGPGSVVGLAPSAAAAQVLARQLGVSTENTSKWIYESIGAGSERRRTWLTRCTDAVERAGDAGGTGGRAARARLRQARRSAERWSLRRGQLVIVDEATLASTLQLAALAKQATQAGAKLLLVGDEAQLSAVESGGAFRLIARDTNAATLNEVWRFEHPWERAASLQLRRGEPQALDAYRDNRRLHPGEGDAPEEAAYLAWRADKEQGLSSVLIAADSETVARLNARARLDRIAAGAVEANGVRLHDGTDASVGDRIVTRANARTLRSSTGHFTRNGDEWTVLRRRRNGSLKVASAAFGELDLPSSYVAQSVELAYAVTAHRAQGRTVDTSHVIVAEGLSREVLYVGMTRGRRANHAYVVTSRTSDEDHQHRPERSARDVLEDILASPSAERSAHEIMREELENATRLSRLVPMHDHLSQLAAADRFRPLFDAFDLDDATLSSSPSYGPLLAALRLAEAQGVAPADILTAAVDMASLRTAKDIAAVLHSRIHAALRNAHPQGEAASLDGDAHSASGVPYRPIDASIDNLEAEISARIDSVLATAKLTNAAWLVNLEERLGGAAISEAADLTRRVAAYRDRYDVSEPDPLGPRSGSHRSRQQHRRELTLRMQAAAEGSQEGVLKFPSDHTWV